MCIMSILRILHLRAIYHKVFDVLLFYVCPAWLVFKDSTLEPGVSHKPSGLRQMLASGPSMSMLASGPSMSEPSMLASEPSMLASEPSMSASGPSLSPSGEDYMSMTSLQLLNNIFLGHHAHSTRISVFQWSISNTACPWLHALPFTNLNLIQCRRVLIHHIVTRACAD